MLPVKHFSRHRTWQISALFVLQWALKFQRADRMDLSVDSFFASMDASISPRTAPTSRRVPLEAVSARQLRFRRTLAVTCLIYNHHQKLCSITNKQFYLKSSLGDASWATRACIKPRNEHSRALLVPSPKVKFVKPIPAYLFNKR